LNKYESGEIPISSGLFGSILASSSLRLENDTHHPEGWCDEVDVRKLA